MGAGNLHTYWGGFMSHFSDGVYIECTGDNCLLKRNSANPYLRIQINVNKVPIRSLVQQYCQCLSTGPDIW